MNPPHAALDMAPSQHQPSVRMCDLDSTEAGMDFVLM